MRDAVGRIQRVLVLGGGSEIAHATLAALLEEGPLTADSGASRGSFLPRCRTLTDTWNAANGTPTDRFSLTESRLR